MTRHLTLAALVTAAAAGLALLTPAPRPALIGLALSAVTAVGSLLGHGLAARTPGKPVQRSLLVFALAFLARLVLVGLGLLLVHRLGDGPVPYVVAFFATYFAFAAIEGGYVHALGRQPGRTA